MAVWRRTIFAHLFLVFSAIIVIAIAVLALVNYASVNNRLTNQAVKGLVVLSRSMVTNIDAQLQNMNRINMGPISSPLLRNQLQKAWHHDQENTVLDMMASISGPTQDVRQFNIYQLNGQVIGVGYRNGIRSVDVRQLPWYATTLAAGGDRVIIKPHYDPFIASIDNPDRYRQYISLCRYFSGTEDGKPWIIEVEQDCSDLFQELDILSNDPQNGRRFMIVDDDGRQVYPYHGAILDLPWIFANRPTDISVQVNLSRHPTTGRNSVLTYTHSLEADWNLVIIQDEERLYPELSDLALQILLFALVVAVAALIGAFWVARRVALPIRWLRADMAAFSLENNSIQSKPAKVKVEGLVELNGLVQAFDRLQTELRRSFAEAVLLRAHKHRAQLLALQSQMHPHFMFNMLATIAVMAEEGQADAIPAVVRDLAELMRSIASSEDEGHTLGDECDFVERYLQCLKQRFRSDLVFRIDCPPEAAAVIVPRLILHPFVENAIKHASRLRPPWVISITAVKEGSRWRAVIDDNGPGFTADSLDHLQAELNRIRQIAPDIADLPDLHVEGLGLVNTFIRLRLSYGSAVVLDLLNRPEGGARVTIGGTVDG